MNVLTLAKGEPLTVLVAPCFIITEGISFASRFYGFKKFIFEIKKADVKSKKEFDELLKEYGG